MSSTSALGTIGASPRNLEPRAANAPGEAAVAVARRVNAIQHVMDVESCERKPSFHIPCALPSRSVLFVLLYSSILLAAPVCLHHVSAIDFSSNVTRGLLIGGSAILSLTITHGGNFKAWFTMALLFHIGVESIVLRDTIDFAMDGSNSTQDVVLASVGAGVIGLHLLPFLLIDWSPLLVVLAMAGVVVNTSVCLFLSVGNLLLLLSSSISLLFMTLVVTTAGLNASPLSQIYCAMFS